jgi:hypothetical protein
MSPDPPKRVSRGFGLTVRTGTVNDSPLRDVFLRLAIPAAAFAILPSLWLVVRPRRLAVAVLALWLVVAAGCATLWARSYRVEDRFDWYDSTVARNGETTHGYRTLFSARGHLALMLGEQVFQAYPGWEVGSPTNYERDQGSWAVSPDPQSPPWGHGGFASFVDSSGIGAIPKRVIICPTWVPLAAFASPPAVVAVLVVTRRRRRLSRRTTRLCLACGYDLRATPGRCPECGTIASVTTTE